MIFTYNWVPSHRLAWEYRINNSTSYDTWYIGRPQKAVLLWELKAAWHVPDDSILKNNHWRPIHRAKDSASIIFYQLSLIQTRVWKRMSSHGQDLLSTKKVASHQGVELHGAVELLIALIVCAWWVQSCRTFRCHCPGACGKRLEHQTILQSDKCSTGSKVW